MRIRSKRAAASTELATGLALVRLRLRLALVTMAIVPVAISLAFVFAVVGSQGLDVRVRVQSDSAALAGGLRAAFQRSDGMVLLLASAPMMADAVAAADPSDPAIETSRHALGATLMVGARIVRGATVTDASGRTVTSAPQPSDPGSVPPPLTSGEAAARQDELDAALALPRGLVRRSAPWHSASGEPRVTFSSPIVPSAGAAAVGVVSVDLSLPALLTDARGGHRPAGSRALLLDVASGDVLIDDTGGARPPEGSLPADLVAAIDRSAVTGQPLTAEGWAVGAVILPLAEGVRIAAVVVDPSGAEAFPAPLVGLLGALALLVVGLAMWMSRQVLRPAEELEVSRTRLREMYEEAREDSLRDGLTGLGNHRAFQEELDRQMEWYRRYRVPLSLLVIDLDDLKLINDSEGHAAGDAQLRWMGRLIADVVRYSDRAFRIGGDEFAILMPHTDQQGALGLGRRLLECAMVPGPAQRAVSFSGGVSSCPELASSRAQLYAQADAALYWCKRHGRSSIDVFDPQRDRRVDQTATEELATAIARVAAERQLRAVFQPIVDLASGRVLGFEGLIRPTAEAPFPDAGSLFAAAETVGRTVELDAACFDVVASAARAVPVHQVLSLNLSPRTVEAHDFSAATILRLLGEHGIDPRRLIVELTEREAVSDVDRLRENLAELQAAGIRIAADDVGAGNAGLRLLSQVRFDIVKIDLSLVQEGAERASSRAVLRSLRDLAGRWGAFVIAEGIETAEQLRVVRELGIAAGQGYLLARPGPSVDLRQVDLAALEAGHLVMQNTPPAPEPTEAPRPERVASPRTELPAPHAS